MDITICPKPQVMLVSFIEIPIIPDDMFNRMEPLYQLNNI